jgi:hypothetical protein
MDRESEAKRQRVQGFKDTATYKRMGGEMDAHRRTKIDDVDRLDVISAVWILSNIDQKPLMTYRGIEYRLNLSENYDVKSIVKERGELFRLEVPEKHLDNRKKEWRAGKNLPAWLRVMEESARNDAIENLKVGDTFRSQFRIAEEAEPSSTEIITWGLEHIERLRKARLEEQETARKARLEEREAKLKTWQLLVIVGASILNVITTIVVALMRSAPGQTAIAWLVNS